MDGRVTYHSACITRINQKKWGILVRQFEVCDVGNGCCTALISSNFVFKYSLSFLLFYVELITVLIIQII